MERSELEKMNKTLEHIDECLSVIATALNERMPAIRSRLAEISNLYKSLLDVSYRLSFCIWLLILKTGPKCTKRGLKR